MNSKPEWKRNLDALSAFLGPTGPAGGSAAAAGSADDISSGLLQALAKTGGDSGTALDHLAESIGANYRVSAVAAKSLEEARLIEVDWSGVVPVVTLTAAGRQIAVTAATPLAVAS